MDFAVQAESRWENPAGALPAVSNDLTKTVKKVDSKTGSAATRERRALVARGAAASGEHASRSDQRGWPETGRKWPETGHPRPACTVGSELNPFAQAASLKPASSVRIEIVLANRRRVIVDASVDIGVLSKLVEALERR